MHVLEVVLPIHKRVRRAPVAGRTNTKLATPALVALHRVAPEQEKRLLALRHRIVFVLKTIVLVPMALK